MDEYKAAESGNIISTAPVSHCIFRDPRWKATRSTRTKTLVFGSTVLLPLWPGLIREDPFFSAHDRPWEFSSTTAPGEPVPLWRIGPGLTMDDTIVAEEKDGKNTGRTATVAETGDLLLYVSHKLANKNVQTFSYRVDTIKLRQSSRFFDRLLSGPFAEARAVAEGLERLRMQYGNNAEAPVSELPSIHVEDIGRVSVSKSVQPLMADFLLALHGRDMEGKVSIGNIANLVVVADRFDSLPFISDYVRRRRLLRVKETPEPKLSEERLRQKLYAGILLEHEAWVLSSSHHIITRGSERWKADSEDANAACWWNIPRAIEGKDETSIRVPLSHTLFYRGAPVSPRMHSRYLELPSGSFHRPVHLTRKTV